MIAGPVVSDARQNTPRTGGASVTLFGLNFLSADSSTSVRISSVPCRTGSWTTVTSVMCVLHETGSAMANAEVTIGASVGTGAVRFTFDGIVGVTRMFQ